jgi:hypothetical protein
VLHELSDLPDDVDQLPESTARNDRMRTEGTRNLLDAARVAGARHLLAQSIAWRPKGRAAALDEHERRALDAGGVVVRYGQLYGPDTFYPDDPPPHPRIHIDLAAERTAPLLEAAPGVVTLTDPVEA